MPSLRNPRMVSSTHLLTPREQQAMDLKNKGLTNEQISAAMGLKVGSAKSMLRLIKAKVVDLERLREMGKA